MSAQDNLSPRQFFHGTNAELKPGDTLDAGRTGQNLPPHAEGQFTYAATTPEHAGDYANYMADHHGGTGHVYEVKPHGEVRPSGGMKIKGEWQHTEYASTSPMSVVGEVKR
jgi:hypothetical protein